MASRLDGIPVFELINIAVPAAKYNLVVRAIKRLGEPLYIPLTGLRGLELIIDHETWVVVDRDLNEIPILAWTEFQVEDRSSIHEPVSCSLKLYHAHAQIILSQVQEYMSRELENRIAELKSADEAEKIIPIKKD